MLHALSDTECRVVGVLMEKSLTTPEQYPLSLHALTNGCNQKSNRFPLMSLSEDDVRQCVEDLLKKHLVTMTTGFGSRVDKVAHRFCNTEFGDITLSEHQYAVITELLLRGPQTPGELRGRCQRLASFDDLGDVESTLHSLLAYQPDPLIAAMPREPGKREVRYRHCFSEETIKAVTATTAAAFDNHADLHSQVQQLNRELAALKERVTALENARSSE
ncbi:YceH family protein [Alteromonas sp. CYL-A6]|uniref:YceH family protein n=1 Tax=Alteromonas nitratireducens TaxID=3390813 RepID=UPI0034A8D63F